MKLNLIQAMPTPYASTSLLAATVAGFIMTSPSRAEEVGPVEQDVSQSPAAPELPPAPVDVPPPLPTDPDVDPSTLPSDSTALPPTNLPAPSENMAINLVVLLVKKGHLSQEEGLALIAQAEADAATAAAAANSSNEPVPAQDGEITVNYVPQTVRNSIRDEIKQELLAESRDRELNAPDDPEWSSRIRVFGDLRARYRGTFFPGSNDNTGSFPNFNAINTGAPFDTSGTLFSPQYNVDQDRQALSLRARLGLEAMLGDGFTTGFRIATGNSSSPVSTNQNLGASGGNFSKYQLWLDRAYLAYDFAATDERASSVKVGRFENPFTNTEILWDNDLGFDGLAFKGRQRIDERFTAFGSAGLFPVFNTDFNFATNQPSKFESTDKWLYGAQVGIEWEIDEDLRATLTAGYFNFHNIEGELSSPYVPLGPNDEGNTDASRPSFAQRGNTYRPLRNITPTAANGFGTNNQWQYYGLASPFEIVAINGRLDYDAGDDRTLSVVGEFIHNIAFDSNAINSVAVNNRVGAGVGTFDGDGSAWNIELQYGRPALANTGDWSVSLGYRHVGSDAVVDAFADSEFGGGGTNLRGFTLGGAIALTPNVSAGITWMSADEVSGPPLGSDILQFDLNSRF